MDDVPFVEAELGAVLGAVVPDGHHVLGVLGGQGGGWHSPGVRAHPGKSVRIRGNLCAPTEMHEDFKHPQPQSHPRVPPVAPPPTFLSSVMN